MRPLRFSTRQLLLTMLLAAVSVNCWVYICHPERRPATLQLLFVAYFLGAITAGGSVGALFGRHETGMQIGLWISVLVIVLVVLLILVGAFVLQLM